MELLLKFFSFSLEAIFLDHLILHLEPPGTSQCGGYLPCWVAIFESAIITLAGLPCSCMSARIWPWDGWTGGLTKSCMFRQAQNMHPKLRNDLEIFDKKLFCLLVLTDWKAIIRHSKQFAPHLKIIKHYLTMQIFFWFLWGSLNWPKRWPNQIW